MFQKARARALPQSHQWVTRCSFNSSGDSNGHTCLRTPRLEKRLIGRKCWRSEAQEKEVRFCSLKFSNFFMGLATIQEPFDNLQGECNTHFKCIDVESHSINIFLKGNFFLFKLICFSPVFCPVSPAWRLRRGSGSLHCLGGWLK